MRLRYAVFAAMLVAGCDLAQSDDGPPAPAGPPATVTGFWSTGQRVVPFDTTFAVEGDPTYASVEVDALFHVETTLSLTDTGGDVRGNAYDRLTAGGEVRYRRHDGVVVRDTFTDDRLGGAGDRIEAVYVAPTLTVTGVGSYLLYTDFVDLQLDFSDGTAVFARRLELPVTLRRLGSRRVTLVRTAETTFRLAQPS